MGKVKYLPQDENLCHYINKDVYSDKSRRKTYHDSFFGIESKEINEILGFVDRSKQDKTIKVMKKIIENELTSNQKECLTLYYFQGIRLKDIAELKGVSISAVSACIQRGKARIKKILKYYI